MKVVAAGVNRFRTPLNALLLITHYQRLLDYIKPHFVHVMVDGAIVRTGAVVTDPNSVKFLANSAT